MEFVKELLLNFTNYLKENSNILTNVLLFARIELIAFAVALYIVVKILLKLLVGILSLFMESDVTVIAIINKLLGAVLALALMLIVVLIIFQILYWIDGPTGEVCKVLSESFLRLDLLYLDNPLLAIIESIMLSIPK